MGCSHNGRAEVKLPPVPIFRLHRWLKPPLSSQDFPLQSRKMLPVYLQCHSAQQIPQNSVRLAANRPIPTEETAVSHSFYTTLSSIDKVNQSDRLWWRRFKPVWPTMTTALQTNLTDYDDSALNQSDRLRWQRFKPIWPTTVTAL